MPRSVPLLIALSLLAFALPPTLAHGATYTQHVCKLPGGQPIGAEGFASYAEGEAASSATCGPHGMTATVAAVTSSATYAGLSYSPPPNTSIFGVRVTRDGIGIGAPGNVSYSFVNTADACAAGSGCGGLGASTYSWTGTTSLLDFMIRCPGSGCSASGPPPTINLRRLEIDLNDAAVPQIVAPPNTGLFDTSRSLRGTETVAFSATDAGGGVSSASVIVDGVERDRRVLDANNGGCQQPYTLSAPCKASVSASYAFDTTELADGRHDVTLQVRDATEVNQATYGPISITVDNSPALAGIASGGAAGAEPPQALAAVSLSPASTRMNGVNFDRKARFSGARGTRTLRFGSATVLRGRLADRDGRPVRGARLEVFATVRRSGAKRSLIGRVTTAADGSYTVRVPAGPSRDVVVAYRVGPEDAAYATERRIVVLVRAGLRMRRSAARLRNGQTLTLTADVLGAKVRARSATIAFQVKVGRRWRTFAARSIGARGQATIKHRFRYTRTATSYRFRARTIRTASFPYVSGVSPVTSVVVRP